MMDKQKISGKELMVLACIMNARSIKKAGVILGVSPRTIESHLRNMSQRLDLASREDLIDCAERQSWGKHLKIEGYAQALQSYYFRQDLLHLPPLEEKIVLQCDQKNATIKQMIEHFQGANIALHIEDNHSKSLILYKNQMVPLKSVETQRQYYDQFMTIIKKLWPGKMGHQFCQDFMSHGEEKSDNAPQVLVYWHRARHFVMQWWILSIIGLTGIGLLYIFYPEEQGIQWHPSIPCQAYLLKRPGILDKIYDVLHNPHSSHEVPVCVLAGEGGSGKTTLSRMYARTQKAPVIFELNAETEASLSRSFQELGYYLARTESEKSMIQKLSHLEPSERRNKLLTFIRQRLKSFSQWILVYDNIVQFSQIKEYVPEERRLWGQGQVIMTTRDMNLNQTSYVEEDQVIKLEELSLPEAQTLLMSIYPRLSEKDGKALLSHIPLLPLDISLAAFYMKNTHMTVLRYMQYIDQCSVMFDKLSHNLLGQVNHYNQTRYGIIARALQNIIKENPQFTSLLLIMLAMNSQNIPLSFLHTYTDEVTADHFFYTLKKYGLITHEKEKNGMLLFSIHRKTRSLGQNFLGQHISHKAQNQAWSQLLEKLRTLPEFLPHIQSFYDMNKALPVKERLLWVPHLKTLCQHMERHNIPLRDDIKSYLLMTIGAVYKHAHYDKRSMPYWVALFRHRNPIIPPLLQGICAMTAYRTFHNGGLSLQGIHFLKEGLQDPGIKNHTFVYNELLTNLALAYTENEELHKALPLYHQAIQVMDKFPDHTLQAETYGKWAGSYRYMTHPSYAHQAVQLAQKALDILKCPENITQVPEETSYHIAKQKWRQAQAYILCQAYDKATKNLNETQYLIDNSTWSDNHLQIEVYFCQGFSFLRQGNITQAKVYLEKSINMATDYLGHHTHCYWYGKLVRLELSIILKQYDKALQDIKDILHVISDKPSQISQKTIALCLWYQVLIAERQREDSATTLKAFACYIEKTFPKLYADSCVKNIRSNGETILSNLFHRQHPLMVGLMKVMDIIYL